MDSQTTNKIMEFYNKPVPKAIKVLIEAHKNGDMQIDFNKVGDVFNRLLKNDVDFDGRFVVHDKKYKKVYSFEKDGKISYVDNQSLRSKLIEKLPKDKNWYRSKLTNMITRYTPDSISYTIHVPIGFEETVEYEISSGSSLTVSTPTYNSNGDVDTSSELEETNPDQYWFNVGYMCGLESNSYIPYINSEGVYVPPESESQYEAEYNVPSEYENDFNNGYEYAQMTGIHAGASPSENSDPLAETYKEINVGECKVKLFKFNALYSFLQKSGFVMQSKTQAYENGKYLAKRVKDALDRNKTIVYFSDIDGALSFAKGVNDVLSGNVSVDEADAWTPAPSQPIGGNPATWTPAA